MFEKIVKSGANLSYVEVVQFAGYAIFIKKHYEDLNQQAFQEWMRVVFNLSVNTSYDRPSDLQRSLAGLLNLIPNMKDILKHFADADKPVTGFNQQQVSEEKMKAQLIVERPDWRPLIDQAERHGYFRGQIRVSFGFQRAC